MLSNAEQNEKDITEVYAGLCDDDFHPSSPASLSETTLYEDHPDGLSHLPDLVKSLGSKKTEVRYLEEAVSDSDSHVAEKIIVSWEDGDEENPHNWTPVSPYISPSLTTVNDVFGL